MVERRPLLTVLAHAVLILGVVVVAFPLYLTFVASTQSVSDIIHPPMSLLPGSHLIENYTAAWNGTGGGNGSKAPVGQMMMVSLITALIISLGKIAISLLSAFAIVYFRFRFRMFFFWAIFITLMLPVEVRILPTYQVVSDLGMLNSYAGLTIPLIASATATFLFRQFFMTVPDELVEAAQRIAGEGVDWQAETEQRRQRDQRGRGDAARAGDRHAQSAVRASTRARAAELRVSPSVARQPGRGCAAQHARPAGTAPRVVRRRVAGLRFP